MKLTAGPIGDDKPVVARNMGRPIPVIGDFEIDEEINTIGFATLLTTERFTPLGAGAKVNVKSLYLNVLWRPIGVAAATGVASDAIAVSVVSRRTIRV